MAPIEDSDGDVFSWQTLSTILDTKLKDVARKSDLNLLQDEVKKLRSENCKLKEELSELKNRMELVERISRRGRLIVRGLTSTKGEKAVDEFEKICRDLLKIRTKVVDIVKINNKNTYAISLESPNQTSSILTQKNKLKDTAVYIDQDLTTNERNARYKLRVLARQLKPFTDIKVRLGSAYIYIDDTKYYWADDKIFAANTHDAQELHDKLLYAKLEYTIAVTPNRSRGNQQVSEENK